jgi:transcriptional regulator with XRE-family HTH domain
MNAIKPLAQTPDTVTLSRADFDALLTFAEDAADLAAVDAHRAHEERVGWDSARQNYLTADEVRRLLDGESAVRIWRVKRGLKQHTLAEAAKVSASYLAEIEGGKKPGSAGALQQIAAVLEMPVENLIEGGTNDPGWRPVGCAEAAARRLIALARQGSNPERMAEEMHATIAEWRHVAGQRGLQHQVKAGIEVLTNLLANTNKGCSAEEAANLRDGDTRAADQMRSIVLALGAALDTAFDAYAAPER